MPRRRQADNIKLIIKGTVTGRAARRDWRVLNLLLHQDRVVCHGFTYFYHHLRSLKDQRLSQNGIGTEKLQ